MICTARFLVTFVDLALAVPAGAQTPTPGVDCSLLTRTQAQGQPCATPPQPDPTPAAPPPDDELFRTLDECRGVTPYDPRASSCLEKIAEIRRRLRPVAMRTIPFALGEVWYEGYMSVQWLTIGLTVGTDGVEIVTMERVGELDNVRALRNVPFEADCISQWARLP